MFYEEKLIPFRISANPFTSSFLGPKELLFQSLRWWNTEQETRDATDLNTTKPIQAKSENIHYYPEDNIFKCSVSQHREKKETEPEIKLKSVTLRLFSSRRAKNLNNIDSYLFSVYLFCPLHLCQLPQAINKALLVQPLIISVLED